MFFITGTKFFFNILNNQLQSLWIAISIETSCRGLPCERLWVGASESFASQSVSVSDWLEIIRQRSS